MLQVHCSSSPSAYDVSEMRPPPDFRCGGTAYAGGFQDGGDLEILSNVVDRRGQPNQFLFSITSPDSPYEIAPRTAAASNPPAIGPNTGIQLYPQSLSPLPGIGNAA